MNPKDVARQGLMTLRAREKIIAPGPTNRPAPLKALRRQEG